MKRFLSIILLTALIFIPACGSAGGNKLVNVTDTVLTIGDESYSMSETMLLMAGQRDLIEQNYGSSIWSVSVDDNTFSAHLKDKLKSHVALVFTGALYASSQGVKLSSDDQKLAASAAVYYYTNANKNVLGQLGLDTEDIEDVFAAYRLANISYDSIIESARIEVSEDEARVMTLAQIKIYTEGLSDNLLAEKNTKAKEAYEKIIAGKDFFSVAAEYDEVGSIQRTVTRDDFPPEAEKVVFSLATGDVSEIVISDGGLCIFKCVDSFEKNLSQARREQLLASRKSDYYCEQIHGYIDEHPIYWYDEVWDTYNIDNLSYDTGIGFYDVYDMFFPEG